MQLNWHRGHLDLDALRNGVTALPETADELKSVARKLGASEADLKLGAAASELMVKQADLSPYRVVYFATHGLVAGEVKGLAEPALALTIPAIASELDDGLLTASEISQLKLNADWVVLSACNTAAGDRAGAEALSGLAHAFFYAGARALLVSHWRVNSQAAVQLTTGTFAALQNDPRVGRAEALRRAMLAMIDDTSSPVECISRLLGGILRPRWHPRCVAVMCGRCPCAGGRRAPSDVEFVIVPGKVGLA